MKYFLSTSLLLVCLTATAQQSRDYAVELSAIADAQDPSITLQWPSSPLATAHLVYRRQGGSGWGGPFAVLGANDTIFKDTTVMPHQEYEYRVQRNGSPAAQGYVVSGIEVPARHFRGKLLLLIDSSFATSLSAEWNQLAQNLAGDGWEVYPRLAGRNESASDIRTRIIAEHAALGGLDALFIFGHVRVPHSGEINPDAHGNHVGAWAADGYYGELTSTWTDNAVNNTSASGTRNDNVPGDGKFDQSNFPSTVELQVGRVDFANLPAFAETEAELLRRYVVKNHNYRHGLFRPRKRAVIDDNFGLLGGEAPGSTAWRNYAPLVKSDSLFVQDFRTSMNAESFQWSYGCGGGTFSSAGGIGNTGNFATDSLLGTFSNLFGSYFGDWASDDNLLRAALATGTVLTNAWMGRPFWQYHHMAMGYPIGHAARLTMNNQGDYYTPFGFMLRMVHIGLMGDPSLRQDVLAPPQALVASATGNHVSLTWTPSAEPVAGYEVYRSSRLLGPYHKINTALVSGTTFVDSCSVASGKNYYMVRATALRVGCSGSYFNLSQGAFDSAQVVGGYAITADFSGVLNSSTLTLSNLSSGAHAFAWDFGNGDTSQQAAPTYQYTNGNGSYVVQLIAMSACASDTAVDTFHVQTGLRDLNVAIQAHPNPVMAGSVLHVSGSSLLERYVLTAPDGRVLQRGALRQGALEIPQGLATGIYLLQMEDDRGRQHVVRLMIR